MGDCKMFKISKDEYLLSNDDKIRSNFEIFGVYKNIETAKYVLSCLLREARTNGHQVECIDDDPDWKTYATYFQRDGQNYMNKYYIYNAGATI